MPPTADGRHRGDQPTRFVVAEDASPQASNGGGRNRGGAPPGHRPRAASTPPRAGFARYRATPSFSGPEHRAITRGRRYTGEEILSWGETGSRWLRKKPTSDQPLSNTDADRKPRSGSSDTPQRQPK